MCSRIDSLASCFDELGDTVELGAGAVEREIFQKSAVRNVLLQLLSTQRAHF